MRDRSLRRYCGRWLFIRVSFRKNNCGDSIIGREGEQFWRHLGFRVDRAKSVGKCGNEQVSLTDDC